MGITLKTLSKTETIRLEEESTPISNAMNDFYHSFPRTKNIPKEVTDVQEMHYDILGWYSVHGFTTSTAMHKKVAALSELFGSRPSYHKTYNERHAVWGLESNGVKFVVYYSTRGLSIQIENRFQTDGLTAKKLLEDIFNQLKLK